MKRLLSKLQTLVKRKQKTQAKENILGSFSEYGIKSRRWWGTYEVETGQSKFWRIGNVVICVDRVINEWHIAHCPTTDTIDENNLSIQFENLPFKTFTFHTQKEIELTPVLPNRPLASKLERPLYIPGGEEILLYISSPVWVRVQTGGNNKVILDEIPTLKLSNTWFGPNTQTGEICYAGHTHCSSHLQDIPSGSDRIISPMLIKNHAKNTLKLESVSVPLPYLSVYSGEDNFLWTEQLYIHREQDAGPQIEVAKGPPQSPEEIQLLTRARNEVRAGVSIDFLLSNLIGD